MTQATTVMTLAVPADEDEKKPKKTMKQLEVDKRKEQRKKKGSSVTGMSEEAQWKMLLQLVNAMETLNMEELMDGLSYATAEGLKDHDIKLQADAMFKQLNQRDYVSKRLREEAEAIKSNPTNFKALQIVNNLMAQAKELGLPKAEIEFAREQMRNSVKNRGAAAQKTGTQDAENDTAKMASDAFSDLFEFANLKDPDTWKGHSFRANWFFTGWETGKDIMLMHSTKDLGDPLTNLQSQADTAIANFTNLQYWMGDRLVSEIQRATLPDRITGVAKLSPSMADEVYVQLMKQLTENPSHGSLRRGYELMLSCCQTVAPSQDLHDYLHHFLMRNKEDEDEEVRAAVNQCIKDLAIVAAGEQRGNDINMMVMLGDYSMRKVIVSASATLRNLSDQLASQLGISSPSDFSCFQATDGLPQHRLLPDNGGVANLVQKWTKLKEMTKRDSKLVFKRTLLRPDEILSPVDWRHAGLTFRQARMEYLKYPLVQEEDLFVQIAAELLWLDRKVGGKEIAELEINEESISADGMLENLLPEAFLEEVPAQQSIFSNAKDTRRREAARKIFTLWTEMNIQLDKSERATMAMARSFSNMQRLELFGSYIWKGKQTMELPQGKVSVPEAPMRMSILNENDPDMEYYICANYVGVRFFASKSQEEGGNFVRDFFFQRDANERVLVWGARQDILQLVVSTTEGETLEEGRPMLSIVIKSTAAVDIAFVIHMLHESQRQARLN